MGSEDMAFLVQRVPAGAPSLRLSLSFAHCKVWSIHTVSVFFERYSPPFDLLKICPASEWRMGRQSRILARRFVIFRQRHKMLQSRSTESSPSSGPNWWCTQINIDLGLDDDRAKRIGPHSQSVGGGGREAEWDALLVSGNLLDCMDPRETLFIFPSSRKQREPRKTTTTRNRRHSKSSSSSSSLSSSLARQFWESDAVAKAHQRNVWHNKMLVFDDKKTPHHIDLEPIHYSVQCTKQEKKLYNNKKTKDI